MVEEKTKIPTIVEIAYTLQLEAALPGLAENMKRMGCFDVACRWWVKQQILNNPSNIDKE